MNHPTSNTQKNGKAAIITFSVHALLLLIFFLLSFKTPPTPPPVLEEGIEVNLGNSDIGFGDIQPLQPGEPGPAEDASISVPPPQPAEQVDEIEKEITDREDEDIPEIKKPVVMKTPPSPKPLKPKAILRPGTGTDGAGTGTENKDTGDTGDTGTYTVGNGSGGLKVVSGNRKIVIAYSFEGELDKATIYATIKVSPSGIGTWQGFGKDPANGKKSTSTNKAYREAIINYLPQIKFNPTTEESMVIVQFIFSIRN